MSEKINFAFTELTLVVVYAQGVLFEAFENHTQVTLMFLLIRRSDEDVVDVREREFENTESLVDVPLEGFPGVSQTVCHDQVLEQSEGGDDCGFLYVLWGNRCLLVSSC